MQNIKCATKILDLKMIIITKKDSNKINYFFKLKNELKELQLCKIMSD